MTREHFSLSYSANDRRIFEKKFPIFSLSFSLEILPNFRREKCDEMLQVGASTKRKKNSEGNEVAIVFFAALNAALISEKYGESFGHVKPCYFGLHPILWYFPSLTSQVPRWLENSGKFGTLVGSVRKRSPKVIISFRLEKRGMIDD